MNHYSFTNKNIDFNNSDQDILMKENSKNYSEKNKKIDIKNQFSNMNALVSSAIYCTYENDLYNVKKYQNILELPVKQSDFLIKKIIYNQGCISQKKSIELYNCKIYRIII